MNIKDRKKYILRRLSGGLDIESSLRLDRDLAAARTHDDLERIEDAFDGAQMAEEEAELFAIAKAEPDPLDAALDACDGEIDLA